MKTKIVEVSMNECTFKFFNEYGNEVPYGCHKPWSFEVSHESFDKIQVKKVELPILDYTDNNPNPIVKIWIEDMTKEEIEDLKNII